MFSLSAIRTGRLTHALLLLFAVAACEGGGTEPKPKPIPDNPVPAISQLDPLVLLQWSDSTTVTVTGSGFMNGSVVRLNGNARLTTYVSPTQLTAVVPVSAMQQAGTLQISVFNPTPGGGESNAMQLPVNHRVPDILSLEPMGVMQGSAPLTLTVRGVGFTQGSVVRWNGQDRPTTFVNLGQVTAQIPASDLEQVGPAQIAVFNPTPGGGVSQPRVFTVAVRPNPVPLITEITPNPVIAEVGGQMTLKGQNFMPGSQVSVGGFTPTPTFVSATELRFTLNGSNVPNAGFAAVQVANPAPGGGPSNSATLQVHNPVPAVSAVSPTTAEIGQDSVVVRVTGTGFVGTTAVLVNGVSFPTRRTEAGEVQATLKAADLNAVGNVTIRAANPGPGGGASNAVTLALVNPAPVVQSISPAQSLAGADSLVVRVTGSGFVPATVVRFQGSARTTRYVSRTQLDVVLTTDDLAAVGTFALTAHNAAPAGGTSAPATLTLSAPVPVLTMIPSNGATAGRAGFVLTVHGSGFIRSSVIRWNGQERETRFISSTRLETTISSADVAAPGTAAITVHTPGGGTSAPQLMTIRAVLAPSVTNDVTLPLSVNDVVYSPQTDRIYASVGISPSGVRGSTVVAINPHTGVITDSLPVGDGPGKLAISDDGTTLWVAVDGSGQVRRISLPGFTLGMSFSTGGNRVEDMAVMPGQPGTLAIALMSTCCTPRHEGVAVYDNGVRRPQVTRDHVGSNLIVFGETPSTLYGQSTEGGGFRTMRVNADGPVILLESGMDRIGYHIAYANGRVYTSGGGVIDAARHELVGSMPSWLYSVAVDAALGRVFFADDQNGLVRVYDMNTLQLINEINVADGFTWTMIRWGTDGLALAGGNNLRIFRTNLAAP